MIVGGVLTASLMLVPATPAAADTTFTTKKNVVTITLKIDVFAGKNVRTGPDGTPIDQYFKTIVENTWGPAFGKFPYKNCFVLELDLDIKLFDVNDEGRKGSHKLYVGTETRGWRGVGWDGAPKETSRNGDGDGTRSFENDRKGDIPANAPPTVVAHEFGHLFGLGDDRADGAPKNGRDGTMMVGNADGVDVNVVQEIDQKLIDRIGKVLEKHLENEGKKLPKCETWKGPISSTYNNVTPCTGSDEGTITVRVVGKDVVSGTVAVSGSYTCPTDLVTVTGAGTVTFGVTGTFTGDEFRFQVEPDIVTTGDGPSAYCAAIGERPIVVPVTERGTAQASFEQAIAGGFGQFTCEITLERQSEDEPVG